MEREKKPCKFLMSQSATQFESFITKGKEKISVEKEPSSEKHYLSIVTSHTPLNDIIYNCTL